MDFMTLHGITIPLTSEDVSPVIWQALTSGSYEAKEARGICKAVKQNDRVLELGAGIGVITSLIAKIPGVSVWAFEANPSTVALARRVMSANNADNVVLSQGILTPGEPQEFHFYVREDLWMSSMDENQGPYIDRISLTSADLDAFIHDQNINVLVMDIEGAERQLLQRAELDGIERIYLELHDHLYGLGGIRDIMLAMAQKGFAYDPRASNGACVLFNRDDAARTYEPDQDCTG